MQGEHVGNTSSDSTTHLLLVNHEEQYSLWPRTKAIPDGWTSVLEGSKDDCLAHAEKIWTDMRPKSVRDLGS